MIPICEKGDLGVGCWDFEELYGVHVRLCYTTKERNIQRN